MNRFYNLTGESMSPQNNKNNTNKHYDLIEENTSPLYRLSFVNQDVTLFENTSLTSHIGNGYFITVNHTLNAFRMPRILSLNDYNQVIRRSAEIADLFNRYFIEDNSKMIINPSLPPLQPEQEHLIANQIMTILSESGYDLTFLNEMKKGHIKPVVVLTFRGHKIFNEPTLTSMFKRNHIIDDSMFNRTSFVIDLELVTNSPNDDIAIYKAINVEEKVIKAIPKVSLDFSLLDFSSDTPLYCLQCAPSSELGRTLNKSSIEGIVDNLTLQSVGKVHDGFRYLLKTYFRFGSSGAPYLTYNENSGMFSLNAIQSEACPIQMDINGMRNGMQYTHALATPIANIKSILDKLKLNTN